MTAPSVHSLDDEQWYFYQNQSGAVSTAPLPVRQLVRLLVPVREGIKPILPPTTQCLPVRATNATAAATEDNNCQAQDQDEAKTASFGQWKAASQIEILKEACCNQWFWTIRGGGEQSLAETQGPSSCRKILELFEKKSSDLDSSIKILVFAQDVTPEWTEVTKLPNLQLVLRALHPQEHAPPTLENNDTGSTKPSDMRIQDDEQRSQEVQDELEAFLHSTEAGMGANGRKWNDSGGGDNDGDVHDDHTYESDGGTKYIKDPLTGKWVHEALALQQKARATQRDKEIDHQQQSNTKPNGSSAEDATTAEKTTKTKKKKSKFSKRNAKHWVYVSGLPTEGVEVEDMQRFFSKAGMIDLDPETLQPKIKLYRDHQTARLKGDASICYARVESVELARQILDDSLWDEMHRIKVEPAKFEAKEDESGDQQKQGGEGTVVHKRKRPVSEAQRKVAKLALLQAQDDGFGERLAGGRKGLRIIVVKGIMDGIPENRLEDSLGETFQEYGEIEKITCISKTSVVIVKFVEPLAASTALGALSGSPNPRAKNVKIEAIYWDGVTDYTTLPCDEVKEQEEEKIRHDEFGSWLDSQEELPPELRLQVATED